MRGPDVRVIGGAVTFARRAGIDLTDASPRATIGGRPGECPVQPILDGDVPRPPRRSTRTWTSVSARVHDRPSEDPQIADRSSAALPKATNPDPSTATPEKAVSGISASRSHAISPIGRGPALGSGLGVAIGPGGTGLTQIAGWPMRRPNAFSTSADPMATARRSMRTMSAMRPRRRSSVTTAVHRIPSLERQIPSNSSTTPVARRSVPTTEISSRTKASEPSMDGSLAAPIAAHHPMSRLCPDPRQEGLLRSRRLRRHTMPPESRPAPIGARRRTSRSRRRRGRSSRTGSSAPP